MRINTIHLVGLAAVLAGAGAKDADAADRTISTATTTPVTTSQPEPPGNVTPGDITVASGGSITVTTNQSAITVDSNNDVSNAGTLASNDANGTRGIRLLGGNTGNITNSGSISLLESYVRADSDNDGNPDGPWAQGSDRHGILLNSGTFTGDILNTGSISIEGNSSTGIRLDGLLVGDLTSRGTINIVGDGSAAVAINGGAAAGVNGDVRIAGAVTVRGLNSAGVLVNAPISGSLNVNGSWNVSGYSLASLSPSTTGLDPDDLLQGGPAIGVHFSVANGVTVEGIGVEDDTDDDADGVTEAAGDTDDDATAAITVSGSSPAMLIQADPSANLVIGPGSRGFGVHIRGVMTSSGQYNGFDATAIQIQGNAGRTVTIANGVAVDNTVRATAFDGDAFGVVIGNAASVSEVRVRRELSAVSVSDLSQTATALDIRAGASVPAVSNSGVIRAQQFGEIGDAVVIRDASNTLATITNSGTILAQLIPTDADPSDDVLPPAPSGDAVAIDVSASTIGVTLNQIADTPFNDDDTTDNDSASRPIVQIEGDVRFGSGADAFNLLAGVVNGDVSFGAGADVFTINNGADFTGRLNDADGQLVLNVQNGDFNHLGGAINLTSATFGASGLLGITLAANPAQSTFINASGAITFAAGAQIDVAVPAGLPVSGSHVFLTAAGGLIGEEQFLNTVLPGTSYLYELRINAVSGDPNSLEAAYLLRSAAALGLTSNQAAAFDNILAALRLNDDAAAAFASLANASTFMDAYGDLMPSYASAATELAATAIQQSQSAASNRLAHTRLHDLDEVSVWAQEIGYGLERTPESVNGQAFRGQGFGLAVGIDGPLSNGALFGLGASFLTSEADEPGRPEGELSTWLTQGNAYLGAAMGPIDLDFVAGVGVGKMRSRRFIEIGSGFAADTEAEWWAYEGHGAVRASAPLAMADWFIVTPQVALTYVYLNEEGYEESGGGEAFDLEADAATSQRLWADAGVEISARRRLGANGFWAPRLYAGYRANAIDEGAERTFRFAAAGNDFTLTDEPLGEGGALVGLGLDATNGYSTLSLSYEGELGDQIERHSVNAAVRFRF
ncbi:MAG: autotransporter outer membrane beta-barrel domain-containing protein [Hyphomonadaceae bacterium]|nr:autotransporter outer membrane beta-barrel domain-containing protein [Hyphomonadaceae bacterium]